MSQNKEKLFTPEDFDKTPQKKPSGKPWWPWLLAAVVVCGGLVFLLTRGNGTSGDEEAQANAPVAENVSSQDDLATPTQDSTLTDAEAPTEEQSSVSDKASDSENPLATADKPTTQQQNPGSANKPDPKPQSTKLPVNDNSTASRNYASIAINGTVEEEAWRTIRGNYGNGAERKEALGNRYEEIQAKVNDFYREGKVH